MQSSASGLWGTLRNIRALLAPVRGQFLPLYGLILLVQSLQLATPYLFKGILDAFAAFTPEKVQTILWFIAGTFVLSLLMSLVKNARDKRIFRTLLTLERTLPVRVQHKLMELSLGYHEQRATGNTVVKVQRGTDRFIDLIANCLFEIIPTVLQLVATFAFLLYLDWRIALVFFPFIPIFVWLTARVNANVRPLRTQRYEGYERAGGQMAQSLMNIHTVQAFAQGDREVEEHASIREDIFRAESKEWKTIINWNFWRDTTITTGRIAVLLLSVSLVLRGETTIGSLVLFLSLSEQAYYSLYRISRLFDRGAEWIEAVTRLTTLLNEPLLVAEQPNAPPIGRIHGSIDLEGVHYCYNGGRDAVHDVHLHISPGKTIAFVGPSGCGKTTIVKLLFRHYDPTAGSVHIDGVDLRDVTLESFRAQMAIVPQEVEIFNRTIRENIAYAKPDATDEDIIRAAKLANAHEFILALANGYDTLVGERGLRLSGGQRQRIGIARALLPDPRILVFDEATSNLDSHAEALIQRDLQEISRGRTTIIIAHRLSTVRHADRIVVFRHGKIVEEGTHDELVKARGVYRQLHDLQMRETPRPTAPQLATQTG